MRSLVKIPAVSGIVLALAGVCAAAGISVTPNTWNPGTVGSGLSYTSNFVVENTGFEMLNVKVKGNNSANWTLASNIGYNQFWMRFDTSGDFSYTNFTTAYQDDTTGTNNMINKKYGQTFNLYIHLTAPTFSNTAATQTITVDIQGTTDDYWTYNASGGFYWRNMGDTDSPTASWATSSSTIMTASKWTYMNSPSSGWLTYGANTFSQTITHSFVVENIRTGGLGGVIAGTCYYSHSSLRSYNLTAGSSNVLATRKATFAKYTVGTLINSALATNTYAIRSVLIPSLAIASEYQGLRRSYSLTFCSNCGYVPNFVTNNGAVNANMSARTIGSTNFSVGTAQARIIVLN